MKSKYLHRTTLPGPAILHAVGTPTPRAAALITMLALALAPLTAAAEQDPGLDTRRTWIGVGIEPGVRGVRITQVYPLTPAFASGLEEGDEILAIGQQAVGSVGDLQQSIGARPPGARVSVQIARGAQRFRVGVVLEAMPSQSERLGRILIGKSAPPAPLQTIAGPRVRDLADLRGKVVVVAFVVTWDEGSRQALEALSRLASANAQELAAIAVLAEDPAALRGWAGRVGPGITVAHDPDGRAGRSYLVDAPQPLLVVIDARGVVRHAAGPGEVAGDDLVDDEGPPAWIEGALFVAERELRRAAQPRR